MRTLTRALSMASAAACAITGASLEARETTSGVNVNATAGVASNPYLTENNSSTTGVFDVDIRPWAHIEMARTTFDLAAYVNGRVFSSRYDFEDAEGGSVSFRSKRDARTSIYGSVDISSTSARSVFPRSGTSPGVADPVNPVDPQTLQTEAGPFIPGDDVTLLGLTGRSTSISTAVGVDHQLSGRSVMGANAGYQHLTANGSAAIGYDSFTASTTYAHQVSELTRVGGRLMGRRTIYDDEGGHSTILVAEGTLERRIDASWSLTAAAGVSSSRTSAAGVLPATRATSISGLIELCNDRPTRNFCARLERSQLPGALGRTRRVDNAVVTFGERLSARDRLDVGARYGRSRNASGDLLVEPSVTVASVEANYTRTLGQRTEAYAFASVARSYSPILSTSPSVNAGVGIRLRLGRTR